MLIEDVTIEADEKSAGLFLRLYRPRSVEPSVPALFWAHGGGYVLGSLYQDESRSIAMARELGIVVAAVRYRLAAHHPFPAAVDDAYAGLSWLYDTATSRGVDPARIAVGGARAGAGLAAGLALVAHDREKVRPVFQLMLYPMLDDRIVTRSDHDTRNARMWKAKNNRYAWGAYLGVDPGGGRVSEHAAPARRSDLSGLPTAWIGVGTLDVSYDEDIAYAQRLVEAGVPCTLSVVNGAFHAFDVVFPRASVSATFWDDQVAALRSALFT